jgi:glutamate synthase (ferredoxin)
MDDVIGRTDLLRPRSDAVLDKTQSIDLSYLTPPLTESGSSTERRRQAVHTNGPVLDDELLADPEVKAAIEEVSNVVCALRKAFLRAESLLES